jgi:FkbM family methyltransferase
MNMMWVWGSVVTKRIHLLNIAGWTNKGAWEIVLSSIRRRRNLRMRIGSITFDVRESEYDTFKEIFIDGEYTSCLSRLDNFRPSYVLDLGGNVGFATIYFRRLWPNCQIEVFEPIPETFKRLLDNTSTIASLTAYNKAVGRKNSKKLFTVDGPGSSSVRTQTARENLLISCEEIDILSMVDLSCVEASALLKVDIEGAEWDLFDDNRFGNFLGKFSCVILEVHEFAGRTITEFEQRYLKTLSDVGWTYSKERSIDRWASVYVIWRGDVIGVDS